MSVSQENGYRAALASLEGVGPARLRWLLEGCTPRGAWDAVQRGQLRSAPTAALRVDAELRQRWQETAARLDPGALASRCDQLGIAVTWIDDGSYPPELADDIDPPPLLFSKGSPQSCREVPRVGIVGTRRSTGYGLRVAKRLAAELSARGVCIVSGLALGIDGAAHRGALAGSGPLVAVAGAGLDAPCPSRNRGLAEEVAQRGWLISEVPPGCGSAPWRFPVRNRIIAALSHAVVVVESAGAGGSLHTAREALDRDVAVLSVPGPIDSRASVGTNELIADGAQPCLGVDDVLVALGLHAGAVDVPLPLPGLSGERTDRHTARSAPSRTPAEPPLPEPTGVPAAVLAAIGWERVTIESVASQVGCGFAELSRAIASLESSGWLRRDSGWLQRRGDLP